MNHKYVVYVHMHTEFVLRILRISFECSVPDSDALRLQSNNHNHGIFIVMRTETSGVDKKSSVKKICAMFLLISYQFDAIKVTKLQPKTSKFS